VRARWKLLGLAGAAGVAATGAAVAANRRPQSDLEPDEIRDRLRSRLDAASRNGDAGLSPRSSGADAPPA
jgi:hypothetical protein